MNRDPSSCGIYMIRNIRTNECYVGSSNVISNRLKDHIVQLTNGSHINKLLLNSWNQYGPDCFEFSILELVKDDKELPSREIYWINKTGALTNGFNTKTDQYKRRTLMQVGPELKVKLESLEMGSMNETLQQLLKFYEKQSKNGA